MPSASLVTLRSSCAALLIVKIDRSSRQEKTGKTRREVRIKGSPFVRIVRLRLDVRLGRLHPKRGVEPISGMRLQASGMESAAPLIASRTIAAWHTQLALSHSNPARGNA